MYDMSDRSPLRELYDTVTAANGWSLRDVEKRSAQRGDKIPRSTISALINEWPLSRIDAARVHQLALGLGISPDRVALAAVQSMGFRVSGESVTPAEAINRDETLSADTRQALLSILRSAGSEGVKGA